MGIDSSALKRTGREQGSENANPLTARRARGLEHTAFSGRTPRKRRLDGTNDVPPREALVGRISSRFSLGPTRVPLFAKRARGWYGTVGLHQLKWIYDRWD